MMTVGGPFGIEVLHGAHAAGDHKISRTWVYDHYTRPILDWFVRPAVVLVVWFRQLAMCATVAANAHTAPADCCSPLTGDPDK